MNTLCIIGGISTAIVILYCVYQVIKHGYLNPTRKIRALEFDYSHLRRELKGTDHNVDRLCDIVERLESLLIEEE